MGFKSTPRRAKLKTCTACGSVVNDKKTKEIDGKTRCVNAEKCVKQKAFNEKAAADLQNEIELNRLYGGH
jgi:hypothetical protein